LGNGGKGNENAHVMTNAFGSTHPSVQGMAKERGWSALPVDVRYHADLAVKGGVRDAHLRPAAV
jgi:hypothetical protein